jgi:transposase-like protein
MSKRTRRRHTPEQKAALVRLYRPALGAVVRPALES